jgi:AcrR family transcriptional regulator
MFGMKKQVVSEDREMLSVSDGDVVRLSSPRLSVETTAGSDDPENVRDRILAAAEELFAQQGFEGTTVREIAKRAACNLAAVNYYYHGKEALYMAVFLRRTHAVRLHVVGSLQKWLREQGETVTLEMLVQKFADVLLEPFLEDLPGLREASLLARESENPHVPLGLYGKNFMEPIVDAMTDALQSLCPGLSDKHAILCVESIIAELWGLPWTQMRCAGYRRHGAQVDVQERARHFVAFCTAGIRQYLGQGAGK